MESSHGQAQTDTQWPKPDDGIDSALYCLVSGFQERDECFGTVVLWDTDSASSEYYPYFLELVPQWHWALVCASKRWTKPCRSHGLAGRISMLWLSAGHTGLPCASSLRPSSPLWLPGILWLILCFCGEFQGQTSKWAWGLGPECL